MTEYVEVCDKQCQTDAWLYQEKDIKEQPQGHEERTLRREQEVRIQSLQLLKVKELKKEYLQMLVAQEMFRKVRVQNEKLRGDIKEVNVFNSEAVALSKAQLDKPKSMDPKKEQELIKVQLENLKEQKAIYDKQNEKIKKELQEKYSIDQEVKLEEENSKLDLEVKKLYQQKKNLEIDNKDKDRKLDNNKYFEQQAKKMSQLLNEVSGVKKQLVLIQKSARWNEKNLKHQEEFIIVLQQKYEEVCEQFDLEPALDFDTYCEEKDAEEEEREKNKKNNIKDQSITPNPKIEGTRQLREDKSLKTIKSKVKQQLEEEFDKIEDLEVVTNDENIEALAERKKKWEKSKLAMNKKYQSELEALKNRLKQLDNEKELFLLKVKEKEKELEIAEQQVLEMSKNIKFKALSPLPIQKQSMNIKTIEKWDKEIRITSKGSITQTSQAINFDDGFNLPESKQYRIQKVVFYCKNEVILGIETEYYLKETKESKTVVNFPDQDHVAIFEIIQYTFKENEYITSISGFFTKKLEFLKIMTNRGQFFEVGDPKNFMQKGCLSIQFDIRKDEKPIHVSGTFDLIEGMAFKGLTKLSLSLKKKLTELKPRIPHQQRQGGDSRTPNPYKQPLSGSLTNKKESAKANIVNYFKVQY